MSAAAEKRLRPLGERAISVTAVSPVGMAKVRLAETNCTEPFVVRPLEDRVLMHAVLLIRRSQHCKNKWGKGLESARNL